jgi:hypothetical protein
MDEPPQEQGKVALHRGADGARPSALLQAKLGTLRRRHLNVAAGAGLARMAGAAAVLVGLEMLLDYWLDIPWAGRACLLGVTLGVTCILAFRHLLRPFLERPDDDALALLVERHVPSFRSRLIATVQLTRPGAVARSAAVSLVEALRSETERLAEPISFASVVSTRALRKFGAGATAALLAGLIALVAGGPEARALLRRAFLSRTPVPRKTRVFVADGDKKIGRGDAVTIEATAQGLIPARGTLVIKSLIRRGQEFAMERATNGHNRYVRLLENVQQSFSYVVKLGDGASATHRIEVLPRPGVSSLRCEQVYPAYTGLPKARRAPGDLVLLAGSVLRLGLTASRPLQQAGVSLEGLAQDLPLRLDPASPREAAGEILIPATNLTGFSLKLVDVDGMDSRDPAVYRVEILPDKAPTVRIVSPERKEEMVTLVATLFVEFQAQDDFQVARAWLRYKVGEAEQAPTNTVELDLAGAEAPRVRRTFPWKVSTLMPPVTLGARVEYWIEVADNNNVTGPGLSASEHQLARVVTPDEKRADLLNRAGDYLGTITDVAGDQERLSQNLGDLIFPRKRP